ncbi:MAG: hypothetical protein EPO01_13970 [Aquabacterium sp.]|jgi:hypothetical protein|nr:MAG: hypothetical protein EPO12_06895 [Aquabacterium sp.]TAL20075.1 MAG: hypothetical protein EPO01_13970 [Aquabacterium sp.]
MRGAVWAVLGISCGLLCAVPASAQTEDPYDSLLSGTWQENWDRGDVCGANAANFTITLDRKAKTVLFQYNKEVQGYDGKMRTQLRWFVREYRPKSLVLALDGETRKGDSGQPLEWELLLVGRGLYRWRATEWPHREVNRVVGVRCTEGAAVKQP